MAISLTAGGIPCQEITPTYTGEYYQKYGMNFYTHNATLPVGVISKLTIKPLSSFDAHYCEIVFGGTVFVFNKKFENITGADSKTYQFITGSSFSIGEKYLQGFSSYEMPATVYCLRLS